MQNVSKRSPKDQDYDPFNDKLTIGNLLQDLNKINSQSSMNSVFNFEPAQSKPDESNEIDREDEQKDFEESKDLDEPDNSAENIDSDEEQKSTHPTKFDDFINEKKDSPKAKACFHPPVIAGAESLTNLFQKHDQNFDQMLLKQEEEEEEGEEERHTEEE